MGFILTTPNSLAQRTYFSAIFRGIGLLKGVRRYEGKNMPDRLLSPDAFHWFCDNVEDITLYRRGGYHPVKLGDCFSTLPADNLLYRSLPTSRYRILHKLGHGSYATVWLARDLLPPGCVRRIPVSNHIFVKLHLQPLCRS